MKNPSGVCVNESGFSRTAQLEEFPFQAKNSKFGGMVNYGSLIAGMVP